MKIVEGNDRADRDDIGGQLQVGYDGRSIEFVKQRCADGRVMILQQLHQAGVVVLAQKDGSCMGDGSTCLIGIVTRMRAGRTSVQSCPRCGRSIQ